MRCAILGFVAGAAWLQTRAALPDAALLGACTAIALALLAWRRHPAMALVAGLCVGAAWAGLLASFALAQQLAPDDEGRDLTLTGTVASLPYEFAQGVRFDFLVEAVNPSTVTVPRRVSLSWYARPGQAAGFVQPGERWRLSVRLQRPHGNANPGVWASCGPKTSLVLLVKNGQQILDAFHRHV